MKKIELGEKIEVGWNYYLKYAFSFNLFLSIDVFMFYTYTLGAADLLTWGS
jgi:hypothetical protein